jgi:hypothetical protein
VTCGFILSIQRSSRNVKSTISTAKEILVAFIGATLPGEFCIGQHAESQSSSTSRKIVANGTAGRSLAEKPKVEELQMDWLRSEDLKEEKDVTAPITMIAGTERPCTLAWPRGCEAYDGDMRRFHVEHSASSSLDLTAVVELLVREEPDEEEEEEEEEDDDGEENDDDNADGYSE